MSDQKTEQKHTHNEAIPRAIEDVLMDEWFDAASVSETPSGYLHEITENDVRQLVRVTWERARKESPQAFPIPCDVVMGSRLYRAGTPFCDVIDKTAMELAYARSLISASADALDDSGSTSNSRLLTLLDAFLDSAEPGAIAPIDLEDDSSRLVWAMNNIGNARLATQFGQHVMDVGGVGDLSDCRQFIDAHKLAKESRHD